MSEFESPKLNIAGNSQSSEATTGLDMAAKHDKRTTKKEQQRETGEKSMFEGEEDGCTLR